MKKIFINAVCMIFFFPGACFRMDREAAEIVRGMTLEQKIGQLLLVGVPGRAVSEESKKIIEEYLPGGIILFGYNLAGGEEIKKFISDLQEAAFKSSGIPMFVSIDQEGGRVKRINDGVELFPGNMAFGVIDDPSLTRDSARVLGMQLRMMGVNMNLAPVLDVNNNPLNPVINIRSFGSDVDVVSRMGAAYIRGLQRARCVAVGKHFPGHGDTDRDSHVTLPVIPFDLARLNRVELPPFAEAIDSGVDCIMTAHISFPQILKNDLPATLSKKFLSDILRKEMGFRGVIITDDLEMDAVSEMMDIGEAAVKSIEAGTDIVLISTHGESIAKVHAAVKKGIDEGRLAIERIDASVKRIIEIKLRYSIMGYENGKARKSCAEYTDGELELLSEGSELNTRASRGSICFYQGAGPGLVLMNDSNYKKIFIISNEYLFSEAARDKNNILFRNEAQFLDYLKVCPDYASVKEPGKKGAVLFYYADKIEPETVEKIMSGAAVKGIDIIVLAAGNPFPLGRLKSVPSSLISFSNTRESVKQMTACLRGGFKPVTSINIFLGFEKKNN